jgi:hypothetical protein
VGYKAKGKPTFVRHVEHHKQAHKQALLLPEEMKFSRLKSSLNQRKMLLKVRRYLLIP